MTTAVSQSSGTEILAKSGWPLYQGTKSAADNEPSKSSPGIPNVLPIVEPVAITTASYFSCS